MKSGKTDSITTLTGRAKEFKVKADQSGIFPDKQFSDVMEEDDINGKIH